MCKRAVLVFLLFASCAFADDQWKDPHLKLTPQSSGTTQLLIAVSPVDSRVVWAAGAGGAYAVTTDGGNTWHAGGGAREPGTCNSVMCTHVSDQVAYLLSIGNNAADFRIYKTVDGGTHWTIEFTNELTNAFYDCFAFWKP